MISDCKQCVSLFTPGGLEWCLTCRLGYFFDPLTQTCVAESSCTNKDGVICKDTAIQKGEVRIFIFLTRDKTIQESKFGVSIRETQSYQPYVRDQA